MKALGQYTISATVVVVALGGVLWSFLDPTGRLSYAIAVMVTLPVQLVAFYLLVRALGDTRKFLISWGGGVLVRMVVVGAVGLSLRGLPDLNGAVLLLSVCGLFFVLLLLEPVFIRSKVTPRFAQ